MAFDARQATRDCVVEIHCGDRWIGAGFFVGRATVMTCAHVLYGRQDPITVRWRGTTYEVADQHLNGGPALPDVGIIKLEAIGDDHPIVLLADPHDLPQAGAVLTAMVPQPAALPGFKPGTPIESTVDTVTRRQPGEAQDPHQHRAAASAPTVPSTPAAGRQLPVDAILLTAVGASGTGGAWKIIGAGLIPGMSGSPVLDSVTQRVCGMLKATSPTDDPERSDRTNWMVGVDVLKAYVPQVVDGNIEAHLPRSAWREAVSRYADLVAGIGLVRRGTSRSRRSGGLSPSSWLTAHHRVVPFHEGLVDFREVTAWVREGEGDVLLVRGPGGVGKTRLGLELCERFRREGWLAGFVGTTKPLGELHIPVAKALRAGYDILLLRDYAEGIAVEVNSLLDQLGDVPGQLRIVLLARSAGRWWEDVDPDRRASEICLSAVPDELALDVVRQAHAAFRAALGGGALAKEEFANGLIKLPERRRLLDLHALALAVALDDEAGLAHRTEQPLRRILQHERQYWRDYAQTNKIELDGDAPLSDRLLVVPTLMPARDVEQAIAAMEKVPDVSVDKCPGIVTTLCGLYPPEGEEAVWDPLQPDRLGEELVADVLLEKEQRVGRLEGPLATADAAQMKRALTVLARVAGLGDADPVAANRRDAALAAIGRLTVAYPRTAVPALVLVAAEVSNPEPLVTLLAPALRTDDLDLLADACDNFPEDHRKLNALADETSAHYLGLARQAHAAQATVNARRALGFALMLRSGRIGRDDPLEAAYLMKESVAIYTALYQEDPDFLDRLVDRLGKYANALAQADQHELALEQAMHAVELFRPAAMAEPAKHGEHFGWLLRVHVSVLITKKRFGDAEPLAQETTAWYLSLAEQAPEEYRWSIAMARMQLAHTLSGLDKSEEAADLQRLVVDFHEQTDDSTPESLAAGLGQLGWYELVAERRDAAVRAARRGAEVCRHMRCGDTPPSSDLLTYLAGLFTELEMAEEAAELTTWAEEAAGEADGETRLRTFGVRPLTCAGEEEVFAELAERDPEVYRLDLVRARRAVAREQDAQGAVQDALRTVEAALGLLPMQRDASPEDAILEWRLMTAHWTDLLTRTGRAEDVDRARTVCSRAVANLEEQIRIRRAAYEQELRALMELE